MSAGKLPEGWKKIEIGDVADVISGGTPKSGIAENFAPPGEGIAWLTPADLSGYRGKYISHGARDLTTLGYSSCSAKLMPKGTILFSSRAPIGYVAIAANEIATNQGFKSFAFTSDIFPDYAYYFLRNIRHVAEEMGTGTTFKEISGSSAKTLPFVLAPLAEQKIIAEKLETLLAQVDTTKARLEQIPKMLKRFRQAVLAAAVKGKLTESWRIENKSNPISTLLHEIIKQRDEAKKNKLLKQSFGRFKDVSPLFDAPNDSWKWVCFEQICENDNNALKAGPFGSALKKSDCAEDGYKVYGQEQVISGQESLETYRITESKYHQLKSCSTKSGDMLISLVGTIGKILILSKHAEVGIINPRLVKITLHEDIVRQYIKFYLDGPFAHDFFKGFSHGGTMEILNLSILKELPIPLPPLSEQHEIVRRVEQLFAYADTIEKQVNNALTRVNNLTQSILAKAFRGELTAQWRAENPDLISGENSAAALLEKIKAERAATASKKGSCKKT
ncbi:Type I restriction enzyme EcoKI specificity protein [Yersinia intermedia]|uniref:restriction endonuclease subunit S n=1 Tax=Yersinia intermedia TaxID=631 RepID=UPI0005E7D54A|nr:restriction endonuclease subunit S [Yersinia intermedia]CQJ56157.1 Type I restriction enzyme EcoKI specificity protein [Yersinia intermedia]